MGIRLITCVRILGLGTVFVALILARLPHLLLQVPKVGYLLYYVAGGPIPGYFDGNVFKFEPLWQREGDVLVSTCTKCGTTWLLQTVHHMRFKGRTPEFNDLHDEVRWIEFVYYPGQPMEERVEILRRQRDNFNISVFKTHFEPPIIQYREDAKYLVGVRSIVDVAASLRQFFPNHDPYFARMWGGFPVTAGQYVLGDAKEQANYEYMLLKDVGNGRPMLDVLVLDHIKGWWPYRKHKNVLFMHYAKRIKDHRGSMKQIADFLGIEMTAAELDEVADKTCFQAMKAESKKYDFGECFNEFKSRGLVPKEMVTIVKDLVQIGPKRSGATELSPSFVAAIKAHVEERFGPAITRFLLEGGEIPLEEELPSPN